MATDIVVPGLGESVKEAVLLKWHKADGEAVQLDEMVCELETDKANVDIPAPIAGIIKRLKNEGETVLVGETIASVSDSGTAAKSPQKSSAKIIPAATKLSESDVKSPLVTASSVIATSTILLEDYSPAVRRLIQENKIDPNSIAATGPNGRLTKEDIEGYLANRNGKNGNNTASASPPVADKPPAAVETKPIPEKKKDVPVANKAAVSVPAIEYDANGINRAPMSKIRKRIAQTLVEAQHTAAILTTFNEVDLTDVIALRTKYKERFSEVHGVGLGFMSFFAKAVVLALKEFPRINAFLEGDEVVYHQYVHLGIAVSTDRGLAVPVLRNVEKMSFARIESEIKRLASATRDGKLSLDELSGGTFTITNGGVFGSLLSTPIINPPQSGILGMHSIQKRPMVVGDKIEARSMMYIALSYDHRLVDGRESVSFLVRLKQYLEDPRD